MEHMGLRNEVSQIFEVWVCLEDVFWENDDAVTSQVPASRELFIIQCGAHSHSK
jgi:hypothetical protein